MSLLLTAVAGSLGALARYLVTGAVHRVVRVDFPSGTAFVNLVGALSIGVILGSGGPPSTWTVASLGFLGGFTTFSTWMLETVRFGVVQGLRMRAVLNLIGQLLIGVILVTLGYTLGG